VKAPACRLPGVCLIYAGPDKIACHGNNVPAAIIRRSSPLREHGSSPFPLNGLNRDRCTTAGAPVSPEFLKVTSQYWFWAIFVSFHQKPEHNYIVHRDPCVIKCSDFFPFLALGPTYKVKKGLRHFARFTRLVACGLSMPCCHPTCSPVGFAVN
jgi:hypothetical protein